MLSANLSASGLFPSSIRRPHRQRHRSSASSSRSSSAFSSQHFTTQSDTEAEEEKKFQQRRQQRRQIAAASAVTPNRMILAGGGRKEFLTPLVFAASCSTPKSSLEDLLMLDETSIYFRPLSKQKPSRYGQNGDGGRESRKQRALEQQQRKMLNDFCGNRQNRRHRNPPIELNKRGSKTSQIARKRQNVDGRIPAGGMNSGNGIGLNSLRRRHHHSSNPLMAFLEAGEGGRCSSPILLDFRGASPGSELEAEGHQNGGEGMNSRNGKALIPANALTQCDPQSNYAIPRKMHPKSSSPLQNCRQHCYSNLSPFLRLIQQPLAKRTTTAISPILNGAGPKSNSDSGMEERNTLEEEWEKQTQFVNISDGEEAKIYENLPPATMEAPQPPTQRPPANPPKQPQFRGTTMANFIGDEYFVGGNQRPLMPSMAYHQHQLAEDVPALYGRLTAAAFIQARNVEGAANGATMPKSSSMPSIARARRIRMAQRELAELVGIRMAKGVELSGTALDSDENFRRKSVEFGIQLAQKLRQTEANSRKEFNWQAKKLQKILHELRMAEEEEEGRRRRSGGEGGRGALQKLFKRVFHWK